MARQWMQRSPPKSSISVRPGPPDKTTSDKTTGNETIGSLLVRPIAARVLAVGTPGEAVGREILFWLVDRRGVKVSYFP